jgi:hypothetical protein
VDQVQAGDSTRDRASRLEVPAPIDKGEPPMHKVMTTLALAGVLIAGLAATPALHAQEPQGANSSTKRPDMQRMMKMMDRKSPTMDQCNKMMQGMMQDGMKGDHGARKPDEQ